MAKVCVTGAAGFIGGHVAEELLRQGHEVVGLDDFSSGKRETAALLAGHARFQLIEGSIADPQAVARALASSKWVFHLAAIPSVPVSMQEPERTTAVNVGGTVNVLQAALRARVERVVLACSCAAYGDGPEQPKHESFLPRPVSPYAAQKVACELYAQTYARAFGLPCVGLRFFNVYGPRQDPKSEYAAAIPRFVTRLLSGQRPIVFGDGLQTRDFVHVSDVVRANLLAATAKDAPGEIVNVASGPKASPDWSSPGVPPSTAPRSSDRLQRRDELLEVVGERGLEAHALARDRVGDRQLGGVQRLAVVAQRAALLGRDQVVELASRGRGASALGQPEEDAVVGSVQLVSDQRRRRRVQVRADLVLAPRPRLAAQERQRLPLRIAVARQHPEDGHGGHSLRVRTRLHLDALAAHRERHVDLELVRAGLALAQRQVGLLHLPRREGRLERARVQGPAAARHQAARLAIQAVRRVGFLARRVPVPGLQRPRQRRYVVAGGDPA